MASADPSVGSVPAPISSRRTSVRGPAASRKRTTLRRWLEKVDSDWAMLCSSPMSASTRRKTGMPSAVRGRHPEPRLVHEGQQAQRLEGDRLAAGVGAGDDQGLVAEPLAQAQINGHRIRDPGAGAAPRAARPRPRRPPAAPPSRSPPSRARAIHRSARASAASEAPRAAACASTSRDSASRTFSSSSRRLERRLGPGVVQLHHGQRLDEQGRGRCALVVDDPRHPSLGLGPDRDHVAPRTLGDDRVSDGPGQLAWSGASRSGARAGAPARRASCGARCAGPARRRRGSPRSGRCCARSAPAAPAPAPAPRAPRPAAARASEPGGAGTDRSHTGFRRRRGGRRASACPRGAPVTGPIGCRALHRWWPRDGAPGGAPPHRSGPGGGRRAPGPPAGRSFSASSCEGPKAVWAASRSVMAANSRARRLASSGSGARDERVIRNQEPIRERRPFSRVSHPDPRFRRHGHRLSGESQPNGARQEVGAAQVAPDAQGLAAGCPAPRRGAIRRPFPAASPGQRDTLHHLAGTEEHGLGLWTGAAHHVHAVVQAVHAVHVQMPRRPPHRFVARGSTARRVRGQVLGTQVRLGLHDPIGDRALRAVVGEVRTQQMRGPPRGPTGRTSRGSVGSEDEELGDLGGHERPDDEPDDRDQVVAEPADDDRLVHGVIERAEERGTGGGARRWRPGRTSRARSG